VYGVLIVAFLLFEPGGVVGLLRRGQARIRALTQRASKGGAPA